MAAFATLASVPEAATRLALAPLSGAAVKSDILKYKSKVFGILPCGRTILGTANRGNPSYIPLSSGIAGDAQVILIPGVPFPVQNTRDYVKGREGYGQGFAIVVVAEVIKLPREIKHVSHSKPVGFCFGD